MRVGIATDHGGFSLKEELLGQLGAVGHEVVDFGAHHLSEGLTQHPQQRQTSHGQQERQREQRGEVGGDPRAQGNEQLASLG